MLQGRQIQQAAIDALLEQAGAGASGALVLRGEPGIGKTALLDYAADRASGQMPALRAVGIESEAELPFAGLHQLVRPALDRLGALPGPQSSALAAAFGLAQTADGPTSAGDRFLVGVGALSLLAELAPVLCLIDDAHWLDRASVEAMLFAARRLHRDGIVMIFTSRDYPGAFPAPGITDVPVPGLDPAAAAALLAARDAALPPGQRDQLIAATRGNPLALIELSVTGATARPDAVGAPVPVTSRVIDAFGHQIRSLSDETRLGLLIAAAAACLAGRDDAVKDIGQALVDEARAHGSIGLLPSGLSQQSWADTMLGNYRDARVGAAEGRQLALDLGQAFWADWMCGTLAYLAAIEGDEDACRDYAGQVRPTEQSAAAAPWAEAALIVLDLGYGRVADSLARMQAAATGPAWHHPNITRMAPDLVEAAVRLGQLSQAAEAAGRFSRWASLVGQP